MRRLALILLLPQAAQAQPSTAFEHALHVERDAAAASCDDEGPLARRVRAIVGRGAFTAGQDGKLDVSVRFTREGDAFVAQVSASGPKPGVRTLRDVGPNCQGLSEGVAVAIALLLDSSASEPPSVTPPPPSAPTPTLQRPIPPSTTAAPTEATRWQARAALSAAGGYGLGGSGTWLGFGRLGAREAHWLFELGVGGSLPARESFDDGGVQTSLWLSTARACYFLQAGDHLALGPCAQVGLGRLRGVGEGYGETRTANLLWSAVSLGLGAELPLGPRWSVTLESSFWVPLERHTFSVQNLGIAWESKPAAGLLGAGISLRVF